MAANNPPIRGVAWNVDISLQDMANPGSFKANPTLAAGDVQVIKDNGTAANMTTLPTVTPAGGITVSVSVSATEMTADKVFVKFVDQTSPKEWADLAFTILPAAS